MRPCLWPREVPRGAQFPPLWVPQNSAEFTFTRHNRALFCESQWGAWRETATPHCGFSFEIVLGSEIAGSRGCHTKGIQRIMLIFSGLHPPLRPSELLRGSGCYPLPRGATSTHLAVSPTLSWAPVAQPEAARLTTQAVQVPFP